MRTAVFLDALHISSYSAEKLYDDKTCIDLVKEQIHRLDVPVYLRGTEPWTRESRFQKSVIEGSSLKDVLQSLSNVDADKIILKNVNNPFLLFTGLREVRKLADSIIGEYVFADGFPMGLIPSVIDKRILPSLAELADDSTVYSEKALHDLIMKHVNAFDVNTYLSKTDHRLLRLNFNCSTRDSYLLCSRFADSLIQEEPDLEYLFSHDAGKLRILPKYYSIQITNQFEQNVRYLPESWYNQPEKHMALDQIKNTISKIYEFSEDAYINLSYMGDCLLHPDIEQILEYILEFKTLKVCIETSGLVLTSNLISLLRKFPDESLFLIICFDSIDRPIYESLRGNGYDEALTAIDDCLEQLPRSTYVQAVRTKVSDKGLEQFYRHFKELTENIIIQKYNFYSGRLPQRKLVDLSPVKRFPCWHLKREMAICIDGRVPKCVDDYDCETVFGNLFTESIEEIWQKGQELYQEQLKAAYCGLCEECDEYYTFNF